LTHCVVPDERGTDRFIWLRRPAQSGATLYLLKHRSFCPGFMQQPENKFDVIVETERLWLHDPLIEDVPNRLF
jgi:hypothetical protein